MPAVEPFLIFTRKFEELGIPYMVSGSVAAIFYGEPRIDTTGRDPLYTWGLGNAQQIEMDGDGNRFAPADTLSVKS